MSIDHHGGLEADAIQLDRKKDTEPEVSSGDLTAELDGIPLTPGRELIKVGHQGGKCYRLEKTRCGKKNCRCTRGELHGPYWYAYYRENGRMRCEYIGKNLPELASLETRVRKACKSSQALRERTAKTVAEVKETFRNLVR